MRKRRTILVVGDSFCDVNAGPLPRLPEWGRNVVSPERILAQPGGAALNVACNLQRLRGDTALYSGIGRDAFGDLLRVHLDSLGVRLIEADSDEDAPTGVCMVLSGPDDRAFCSHFGVSDAFDASALVADGAALLRRLGPCHVHCAGYFSCAALRKTLPRLLLAAREVGATTSLDTNNDASGQWGAVDGLWDVLLPLLDLFTPNELEACAVAGVPAGDVEAALARLSRQVGGSVVITRGRDGALVGGRSVETRAVSAPPVVARDAVGAGDAFKAGLLACFVSGADLAEAAQYGCLTGALCVTTRGACSDPPDGARVAAFAAQHGLSSVASALPACGGLSSAADGDGQQQEEGRSEREEGFLWWTFALLWLGGTWPYQSILQAQAYYEAELPDLAFLVLMTFSWPLVAGHAAQVLSGAAKAAGFSRRVLGACCVNAAVGVAFLLQDAAPLSPGGRRTAMTILAALVALAQLLLEPALFGLAACSPRGSATQAMMVGNASAGVVVVAASALTRLAAGGAAPSGAQLGIAARAFFGLQVASSAASCALYLVALRRSPRLLAAARGAGRRGAASSASAIGSPLLTPDVARGAGEAPPRSGWRERGAAVRAAAGAVWLPAACQALCFGTTLAAWPSIPGAACVEGGLARLGQGWWFTLVVLVYNVVDFAARLHLPLLQRLAARARPRSCLAACAARTLLVPLIYACVRPRLVRGMGGNVVLLLATALLALSNGVLATASMMQVARLAPEGLREEGVYVAVAGVYFGLAAGATVSWAVGRAMQLPLACG